MDPINFIEFLDPDTYFEDVDYTLLNEIKNRSWPYLVVEFAVRLFYDNGLKFQKIAIMRITAEAKDMLQYAALDSRLSFLGTHENGTGTIMTIPAEYYNDNKWNFDVDQLVLALL